jgi:hypothetical protein
MDIVSTMQNSVPAPGSAAPVHLCGKRFGQPQVVAAAVGQFTRRLFYVSDRLSGHRLLVDTGAQISVLPARTIDKPSGPSGTHLCAANGSTISTFGHRTIPLQYNNHQYEWKFIIAAVNQPLLGADFRFHHGLLVDIRNQRLLD